MRQMARTVLFFLIFNVLSAAVEVKSGGLFKPKLALGDASECVLKVEMVPAAAFTIKAALNAKEPDVTLGGPTGFTSLDSVLSTAGARISPYFDSRYQADFLPQVWQRMQDSVSTFLIDFGPSCSDSSVAASQKLLMADPLIAKVRRRSLVEMAVEPLLPPRRVLPNDPGLEKQYALHCFGQVVPPDSREGKPCNPDSDIRFFLGPKPANGYRGKIILATLDSGVELGHKDLPINRISRRFSINFTGEGSKEDIGDINGHGTHVFGLHSMIENNYLFGVGTADEGVEHVIIRIFGKSSTTTEEIVSLAVWKVVDIVERLKMEGVEAVVLSTNSWIVYEPEGDVPGLREAILAHLNSGATFVGAAGNGGKDLDKFSFNFPASWIRRPEFRKAKAPLIIVAATDLDNELTGFSDYGWFTVNTAVPGANVYSTASRSGTLSHYDGARYLSGTSMSTPIAAGVISRLFKKEGPAARATLGNRIAASSDKFPQFWKKIPGRLNVYQFLMSDARPPEPINDIKVFDITHTSAKLRFTVPWDFSSLNSWGFSRDLGLYYLATSDRPINPDNFFEAKQQIVAYPQEAGTKQELEFVSLKPGSVTHGALLVLDKGGNQLFVNLPVFKTNPVYITWLEHTGNFLVSDWEFRNANNYRGPVMWRFKEGELRYQLQKRANYDTSAYGFLRNEGLALSPWVLLPKDPVLSLTSKRDVNVDYDNRGLPVGSEKLLILVYQENGETVEIASLKPSGTFWTEDSIRLFKFSGKKVRIGFYFTGMSVPARSGVAINRFEIYGTRVDVSLPLVANGGFEEANPTEWPQFERPVKWNTWQRSFGTDRTDGASYKEFKDWHANRFKNDENKPENVGHLRLWNETGDKESYVFAASEPIKIKPDLYELSQMMKIGGDILVTVHGYKSDGTEVSQWLGVRYLTDGWWRWEEYIVPFAVPRGIDTIRIRYALRGKARRLPQEPNPVSAVDIDNVKIDFLKKTFPDPAETQN